MAPIIGVTQCRALPDYLEAVKRAGGNPRVLDLAHDTPAEAIGSLQGLLLTGGGDLDPATYGEIPRTEVAGIDQARDRFEIELTNRALDADLPVLAICRGLQVLNVARGGSLVQDIPSEVPGALEHSVKVPPFAIAHEVWLSKGSRVWTIMQESLVEDALAVNSRHHQAVRRLAPEFEATATAPDGVVEVIEHRTAFFCIGVQWHPENFWRTGEFRPLFEAFNERSGQKAARTP
jgi:putative glutamine amidotransferase